jgi:hypothetical protein
MRRKCGLFIVSLLLSGIMFGGVAGAAILGVNEAQTGTWVWSGVGTSISFSGDMEPNYTFGISSVGNYSNSITLLPSTTFISPITVANTGTNESGDDIYSATVGTQSIELGTTAEFELFFTNPDLSNTSTYNVLNSDGDVYFIRYGEGEDAMHVTLANTLGELNANAVPIPGSVLLLGSSLLGLLGIGSRRNKA